MEASGLQYGFSPCTIASLLEAIHSIAWHCANVKFGNKFDAEEDLQTAQKHWAIVRQSAELDDCVIQRLQSLTWNACWCTVNWRSGCKHAKHNMKLEQREAQMLGLRKKAAWCPRCTHWRCNREMAWKQAAAPQHLFSNSVVAVAEVGGLGHGRVKLQQGFKHCVSALSKLGT